MKIVLERTRIIISDYNMQERIDIEELVSTIDKSFFYEDTEKQRICILPGMLNDLKKVFPKVKVEDRSKDYWDYAKIEKVNHNMKWRNQLQEDFINFLIKSANQKKGKVVGVLAPGTGKTFMACYTAIKLGLRTLIIAPNASIRDQWVQTLLNMFGVEPTRITTASSPRIFSSSKSDFVVTTQSLLTSIDKNYDLEKILRDLKFGIKIIDETHLFFSNLVRVDGSSNICHNWYLTGTYGRSGLEENILYLKMFDKSEIFTVKDKKANFFDLKPGNVYGDKPHTYTTMVWARSHINKEQIKSVMISNRKSERTGEWVRYGISIPAYTEVVMPSDGRITEFMSTCLKVIKKAYNKINYGKILILVPTIKTVDMFHQMIVKMYPDKVVSRVHSKVRIPNLEVLKKESDIIISTIKSTGTGFDWKDLSRLIVLDQYKSPILCAQVIGRLRRRIDNKPTYMWDVVDSDIRQLRVWANSRAITERKVSKEFKVIDM